MLSIVKNKLKILHDICSEMFSFQDADHCKMG